MPQITEIEDDEEMNLDSLSSLRVSNQEDEIEKEELDDEDDDDDGAEEVALGFVEKSKNPNSLLRHMFPSKAGGVPAWLNPVDLPSEKSRSCGICGDPLQFLLQVYAPIANKETAFHRTLFVFMCPSMKCLLQDQHEQWKRQPEKQLRSVKVFRCQLARANPFYSKEPPRHDKNTKPTIPGALLCNWCGTWKGDKVCASCKCTHYCSEKHQVMHWHSGHKTHCQRMSIAMQSSDSISSSGRTNSTDINKGNSVYREQIICSVEQIICSVEQKTTYGFCAFGYMSKRHPRCFTTLPITDQEKLFSNKQTCWDDEISFEQIASNTLWPEFEIINEDECVFDSDESEQNFSSSLVSKDQIDESVKSLMDTFEGDGDKKAWASFEERLSKAPEQVLRYSQDEKAKPLWPMSSGRPSKADIPKCNYCNGPLCYELQILPQLLYYFGVKNDADSLDWATIVVYTCVDSCETSVAYKEEFAWVQLSPSVALPS